MTVSMRYARQKLGLTQMDLSQLTRVNQAILSQIETGRRTPTPMQKERIRAALGPVHFYEKEDFQMFDVSTVPEMRWNRDGTPDFSHLDGNDPSVRDQLEALIVEKNGDGASVKQVSTSHCFFEVLDQNGESVVYIQAYLVMNGKASLYGDATEAGKEFEALSYRRVAKAGVPEIPTGQD